jgi:uncharacterized membrane protein
MSSPGRFDWQKVYQFLSKLEMVILQIGVIVLLVLELYKIFRVVR